MLASLFDDEEEFKRVLERFKTAFKRSDEEEAELARLLQLEQQTLAREWPRLAQLYDLGSDHPPSTEPPSLDMSHSWQEISDAVDRYEQERGLWDGMP